MAAWADEDDLSVIITNLTQRVMGLEIDFTNFKKSVKDALIQIMNRLLSFVSQLTTNAIADWLSSIPYIGPILGGIVRAVGPTLQISPYDGLAW